MTIVRTPVGPVGHWTNPRPIGSNADRSRKLENFGRLVLAILDDSPNWNDQTLDLIAEGAHHFGLVNDATPVIASTREQRRNP